MALVTIQFVAALQVSTKILMKAFTRFIHELCGIYALSRKRVKRERVCMCSSETVPDYGALDREIQPCVDVFRCIWVIVPIDLPSSDSHVR